MGFLIIPGSQVTIDASLMSALVGRDQCWCGMHDTLQIAVFIPWLTLFSLLSAGAGFGGGFSGAGGGVAKSGFGGFSQQLGGT